MNDILDPGDYVYVKHTDSGPGMESEVVERAFEPFFTTRETGRGMGLATLLGGVRAHNGAVSLESTPGDGVTVTLLFPHWRMGNP
jgi:signal transduction histidine kinase